MPQPASSPCPTQATYTDYYRDVVICREAGIPLFGYFVVLLGSVVFSVELPLFYLRALRAYVVEHQEAVRETS